MRIGFLAGSFLCAAVVVACSDNGAVTYDPGAGADGGSSEAGADAGKKVDGGSDPGDAGSDSGSAVSNLVCPVPVVAKDIIEVHPPKDNTQGACTDMELSKVTGSFAGVLKAVSATCASCLFTESNDMTNSQIFIWNDSTHTTAYENFGACYGSAYSGGNGACGKAAEELESCLQAACPLDSMGNTKCTQITNQDCVAAARGGDCMQYEDKETTDCGGAAALQAIVAKCFDVSGSPKQGIRLLCGPP